ncbi:MAG: hypothetical protein LBH98_09930 [Chitinispirillales bacterium]|nr:hypothetical protein [Chitinispirillales bacterium]
MKYSKIAFLAAIMSAVVFAQFAQDEETTESQNYSSSYGGSSYSSSVGGGGKKVSGKIEIFGRFFLKSRVSF